MKNLLSSSLIQKIIFVLSIALIFFISVISYKNLEKLSESTKMVNHTYNISLVLDNLFMSLKELETDRRNYILEENDSLKNAIISEKQQVENSYNNLKALLQKSKAQENNLKELNELIKQKFNIVDQTLSYPRMEFDRKIEVIKTHLLMGSPVMRKIKIKIADMKSVEAKILKQRTNVYDKASHVSPLINLATLLITITILTFSLIMLLRKLNETRLANAKLTLAHESSKMAEQIGNYGTWQYNVDRNEFQFSDNEYRLFGFEPQDLGHKLEKYIEKTYPEELQRLKTLVKDLEITSMLGPNLYKITKKDGEARQIRDVSKLLKNIYGEKILIGVTKDVTDEYINQKKIKLKNIELEQKNKVLFLANEINREAEKTGKFGTTQWFVKENRFIFSDNNYRLLGLNPSAKANFEELFGHIHQEDVSLAESKLQQMISECYFDPYILRVIRNDNEEIRFISLSSKHIKDYENEDYVLIISVDVTEIINAQNTIIERNKELEESNKELQAFNYVASHDLQEPLRKIETFISRLEQKDYQNLSEIGQQYFNRIKISADRMRMLIEDLLQFSRTNKSEEVFEKTNLNKLLENAKNEILEFIEEKNAIIESMVLPTLDVIPFQIQQLFINLLGNSIKYSKPEVQPVIKIEYKKVSLEELNGNKFSKKKAFHKITVTDNGIGFEPTYSERIFELFSRLHNKDEIAGTGIGLAICKKIIDNHAGFITGDGKPGEGSVFTIYLPD